MDTFKDKQILDELKPRAKPRGALEKRPCGASDCMMKLSFGKKSEGPLTILCLGAHSDDIEIGCGGTLLQLRKAHPKLRFHWVVLSATGTRSEEARKGC